LCTRRSVLVEVAPGLTIGHFFDPAGSFVI
jgi:hypothetical protein